jgi:hypothetical protein
MPASVTSSLPGEHWRQLLRLRGEYGVLREERVEAMRLQADNSRLHSNWVQQLAGGKKLTLAQVEPYLNANQRNAQSLVAASRLTGDLGLLREALEKYPDDPLARFAACFAFKEDARPDDRRAMLEAFKESAPDNALADYVAAQEHFKRGRREEAVLELVAAADKPRFQDYYGEFVQNTQAAYESVGLSSLEDAELSYGQPLPHLAELRGLGESLTELAQTYRQSGDEASATAALQLGVALGRQLVEPGSHSPIIGEFVGMAIEKQLLETLDPADPYDASGRTVRDRLDELVTEREARKALWKQVEPPADAVRRGSSCLLRAGARFRRSGGVAMGGQFGGTRVSGETDASKGAPASGTASLLITLATRQDQSAALVAEPRMPLGWTDRWQVRQGILCSFENPRGPLSD